MAAGRAAQLGGRLSEHETETPEPAEGETDEIGTAIDPLDPMKRDEDQPGLDPIITLPPD